MTTQSVNTPRRTTPGNGPYGDSDIDIATAGKTGVHFFENLKVNQVSREQREKEILLDTKWPFPGEGTVVQQQNGFGK